MNKRILYLIITMMFGFLAISTTDTLNYYLFIGIAIVVGSVGYNAIISERMTQSKD